MFRPLLRLFIGVCFVTMAAIFIALFACSSLFAQIDTTSFPDERQALRRLTYNAKPVTSMDCNNFITASPEGDISFSFKECKTAQIKQKAAFKFIAPMPCHEFIGIYDGNAPVVGFLANVYLSVDGQDEQ